MNAYPCYWVCCPPVAKQLGLIVEKEISPPFILRAMYLFSNLTKKHI
jgi:hypothetical protein